MWSIYQVHFVCASVLHLEATVDMVTKTSALELGPKGIRVNSVNPGFVETSFGGKLEFDSETKDKFYADRAEQQLLKRAGQPEDVARLVAFLASDDAKNITGSICLCDSGAVISSIR